MLLSTRLRLNAVPALVGLMLALLLSACSVRKEGEQLGVATAGVCKGATLSLSPSSPASAGATVTLIAAATNCGPGQSAEYRFVYRRDGTSADVEIRAYGPSASASFNTTGLPSGKYTLKVLARALGSSAASESSKSVTYLLGGVCNASPTLKATPTAPPNVGTAVALTASVQCTSGAAPEYRFVYVAPGKTTETEIRGWGGATATFNTPGLAGGIYQLKVYARGAGNSSSFEATKALSYKLGDVCTGVTLALAPASPSPLGASVTLTGNATCLYGGSAEYRFYYRHSGTGAYIPIRSWGGASAAWSTAGLPDGPYDLQVQARAIGHASGAEVTRVVVHSLGAVCKSVALTASPATSGVVGAAVALSASASCVSPSTPQYRFSFRKSGTATWTSLAPAALPWSPGAAATWSTNGLSAGKYQLRVEARAVGHAYVESSQIITYTLSDGCGKVALSVTPEAPQAPGMPLTLDATATCSGGKNAQYRFLFKPATAVGTFRELRGWDSHTMTWGTLALADGSYVVRVEARAVGSTAVHQSSAERTYALASSTQSFKQVSAGHDHSCGLRADGSVACWGDNSHFESRPPPGVFLQVAAGENFNCALRFDHYPTCWGDSTVVAPSEPLSELVVGQLFACGLRVDHSVICWGFPVANVTTPPAAATYTQLTAGGNHACGRKLDGSVECWGNNTFGESSPPAGSFRQISAGQAFTCGIRANGEVSCWGDNTFEEAAAPAGTFAQIAAGGFHTCGVRPSGAVDCWGGWSSGQSLPPPGLFTNVSAGYIHSCGIRPDGEVSCWGGNAHGESTPSSSAFASVSAGTFHVCATRADGTVSCWGYPNDGATAVPPGPFMKVSAGNAHSCGIHLNGSLECWGNHLDFSPLPPGSYVDVSAGKSGVCGILAAGYLACSNNLGSFAIGFGNLSAVSTADGHFCALADDQISCWPLPGGSNSWGQIDTPDGNFVQVSAGDQHNCAIRSDDRSVYCWGRDDFGQSTPPQGQFRQVSAGRFHSCAVRLDDSVVCWGDDFDGESTPPAGAFASVSAGDSFSCATRLDGGVSCWGKNNIGQTRPPGAFADIAAGGNFSCALTANRSAVCWGASDYGQTQAAAGKFAELSVGQWHACGLRADGQVACWGRNDFAQASAPPGPFIHVSAGGAHSCGTRPDGSVECWGFNDFGQAVAQAGPFQQVASGFEHNCGVQADSTAVCWGLNNLGQTWALPFAFVRASAGLYHSCGILGTGSAACWGDNGASQLAISPSFKFIDVTSGSFHSCGLLADGSARCWGRNDLGQGSLPDYHLFDRYAKLAAGGYHNCALYADGNTSCWGNNGNGQATPPGM